MAGRLRFVHHSRAGTVPVIEIADRGVKQTTMGSRPRVWTTIMILSFPFLAVGVSTCTAAAGK